MRFRNIFEESRMRKFTIMFLLIFFAFLFQRVDVYSQTKSTNSNQKISLEDLLKQNSYELKITGGILSGDGKDFLIKAAERTQFFTIAEPHNAKEVPEITTLIFKLLHEKYGYNYLALEQDPIMGKMVSAPTAVGKRDFMVSLARKYPNAFTFITDQELEMIAEAGKISDGKGNKIWGIDQVFGVVHALEKLVEYAPNDDVRQRTLKLLETLKKNEAEEAKKLERYTMADVVGLEELDKLLADYKPEKNPEAEFIIAQMILSRQIYKNNIRAGKGELTGFISNQEREENMKMLFINEYRKAQIADKSLPKVLLKAGHYHTIRGRNWSNVLSLGNFLSEFAKSNDMESFHLALYNNNVSGDYGVLSKSEDYKPLAAAASTDKWVVIDLRPIRNYAHAGKIADLNAEMRRIIFGFDAALLIGGGSRGTYKLLGVQ